MNFGAGGRRKFKQPCKFAINGTKLQETLKAYTLKSETIFGK